MSQDPLRRITAAIPAYGGYREREIRRESDKLIRRRVLSDIAYALHCVEDSGRAVYSERELGETYSLVDRVNAALRLLDTYVRSLESGYAPLYAQQKINEDKLDSLIRYDEAFLNKTERLRQLAMELKMQTGIETDATKQRLQSIELVS